MATAEAMLAVMGMPVASDAVRALIVADGLASSADAEEWGVPGRAYLTNQTAGYSLTHTEGRIVTLFIYVEPTQSSTAFRGELPGGLPRGAGRREVLARFGAPERSGSAVTIPGLGRQGPWDRFAVGELRIHFQYTEPDERVRLVTIMTADAAP